MGYWDIPPSIAFELIQNGSPQVHNICIQNILIYQMLLCWELKLDQQEAHNQPHEHMDCTSSMFSSCENAIGVSF